jgi:type I restriction enzyme S subunit
MSRIVDLREDYLDLVKQILRNALHDETGVIVYAFGSRVKGKAKEFSDLDLAIDNHGKAAPDLICRLLSDFEESDLPFKVDVIDLNDISESFYDAIRNDLVDIKFDWKKVKLGEVCSTISRGVTPLYIDASDCRVLNQKCIRDGRVSYDNARYHDADKKQVSEEKKIKSTDTLICSTGIGTLGRVGRLYQKVYNSTTVDSHVMIVRPKDDIDHLYLSYTLISRQNEIEALAEGSTGQTELSRSKLSDLNLWLPPLSTQRTIADLLGSLDDKIEANRVQSKTLEAIAQALFKSWFVDFEPVKAKSEGRQPDGLAPEIADLFPFSFVDSPLGKIPKGWEVSSVGKEFIIVGGGTPSTLNNYFWHNGTVNWATPKDLASLSTHVLMKTERKITELGLSKISSGVLKNGSVLLSSRAPIGYLAITNTPVAINQGFIGFPKQNVSSMFILHWLKENISGIVARANGSTFLEISKTTFRPMLLVVPDKNILKQFDEISSLLYKEIINNEKQSQLLVEVRDLLLPRLVDGRVCLL